METRFNRQFQTKRLDPTAKFYTPVSKRLDFRLLEINRISLRKVIGEILICICRLVALLQEEGENEELLKEVAILLGSLAKGSQEIVDSVVEAGTVQAMLTGKSILPNVFCRGIPRCFILALLHGHRPFVQACLRCLRSIFLNASTIPIKDVYNVSRSRRLVDSGLKDMTFQDPNTISVLLSIANASSCNQECVAIILSRSCQVRVLCPPSHFRPTCPGFRMPTSKPRY